MWPIEINQSRQTGQFSIRPYPFQTFIASGSKNDTLSMSWNLGKNGRVLTLQWVQDPDEGMVLCGRNPRWFDGNDDQFAATFQADVYSELEHFNEKIEE